MSRDAAVRWLSVVAGLALAVAIAVSVGRRQREEPDPAPAPPPPPSEPSDPADPAFGRDECAARLKRIGQALLMYAEDHDGSLPVADSPLPESEWFASRLGEEITEDLVCPSPNRLPYVYHSYRDVGAGNWSRWMEPEHIVTADAEPDTWLMSDYLDRDSVGPHAIGIKAFNYLCVDGHVGFQAGRPREVYK